MDGENLHYAILPATISADYVAVFTDFEAVDLEELVELIDDLP